MEIKIKKLIFLSMTAFFISLMAAPYSAYAEYYVVYPGSDGFCCPPPDIGYCCPYVCSGYYEHHAKRARATPWVGTSEYAWIPDPADP